MLLVFLGTLAQVHLGIHAVQARYFQSLFVYWSPQGASWRIPILPGGYLLGTVLFINLIAAHATRFQLSKKKLGIILLHLGVVLLLIGQLLTGLFARETMMRMDEGQTLGYSESPREVELAVIDTTDPSFDQGSQFRRTFLCQGQFSIPLAFHFKIEHFPQLAAADASTGAGSSALLLRCGLARRWRSSKNREQCAMMPLILARQSS